MRFPFFWAIFAFMGTVALGLGIVLGVLRWNLLSQYDVRTPGTVVRYERHRNVRHPPNATPRERARHRASNNSYRPVVEYECEGQTYQVTGRFGSSRPGSRGQVVTVAYLSTDPEEAIIDSFAESWAISLIFGAVGAVFAALGWGGCLPAWLNRRSARPKNPA